MPGRILVRTFLIGAPKRNVLDGTTAGNNMISWMKEFFRQGKYMANNYFSGQYLKSVSIFFLFFLERILFSNLISVFLLDQGYSAFHVSIVSSCSLIASFCAVPIIGKYTDIYGTKHISTILIFISCLSGIGFAFSKNLFLSGLLYCTVMICINTMHPVVEKLATQTSFNYGAVRIWGTLGNAIGTQLSGILYQYISPRSVYIVFSLICVITWLISEKTAITPVTDNSSGSSSENNGSMKLSRSFFLYIIVVFLFYAALDAKTLYLTAFFNSSGFSINSASTIIFIASLLEIPVVLFGGRLVDQLSGKLLTLSCLILLAAQLSAYSFFSSPGIMIIATILTNSVVSMLYIMINMKVISELIDAGHQLSALTITSGIRSLAAVIGQTIGGRLIDLYSYQNFFIFLLALILMAMLITLFIRFPKHSLHLYT